jgi:hypothetical protein
MPKAKPISAVSADDIAPSKARPVSSTRQRGVVASEDLVSMGFKLEPYFVQQFKRAALDRDMKLNEFLIFLFREFLNSRNRE